jgi:hypothetical protein
LSSQCCGNRLKSIELIDFFGEILKIVKLNSDPVLSPSHSDCPDDQSSFIGKAIADYDRHAHVEYLVNRPFQF